MRKKYWLLGAAILAILASVACFISVQMPGGPGVTKVNFSSVADGMTKAEVEAIFGKAPDAELAGAKLVNAQKIYAWICDDEFAGAIVVFDQNDRVLQKEWRDQTFLGRIRSLLPF